MRAAIARAGASRIFARRRSQEGWAARATSRRLVKRSRPHEGPRRRLALRRAQNGTDPNNDGSARAVDPGRRLHGHQPEGQRGEPLGAGRAGHAAALCAAQRSRAQRRQVRLRARAMRRLHGADRRQGRALLRDADRHARQRARSPRSRGSARSTSRIRCSRPSSTSRRRSAATASAA